MSSEKPSKFDIWWNSTTVKRVTGAIYGLGAAVVILGALFKIQHWAGAGIILSAGMFTEALLFALGIFDRPHKDYEWEKVFTFDGQGTVIGQGVATGVTTTTSTIEAVEVPQTLSGDMKNLSSNIQALSDTAKELTALSGVMSTTKDFVKNIESASSVAAEFTTVQSSLNKATGALFSSYESLSTDMNSVVSNTSQYAEKVGEINKNLASINSIYELQLKNIKDQADVVSQQAQHTSKANETLSELIVDNQKIMQATKAAVEEANKFKDNSTQLANQIAELNKVYGNMLNALS